MNRIETYRELVEIVKKQGMKIKRLETENKLLKDELETSELERLRMRLYNGKGRKRLSDKDLRYYYEIGRTAEDIADEYGLKEQTVINRMKIFKKWGKGIVTPVRR